MQTLSDLIYSYQAWRVRRFSRLVCNRMLLIYNYLYAGSKFKDRSACIKEAITELHEWRRVSADVFKHQRSGVSVEIGRSDTLAGVTSAIISAELPHLFRIKPNKRLQSLDLIAQEEIKDFFKIHETKGEQGA